MAVPPGWSRRRSATGGQVLCTAGKSIRYVGMYAQSPDAPPVHFDLLGSKWVPTDNKS